MVFNDVELTYGIFTKSSKYIDWQINTEWNHTVLRQAQIFLTPALVNTSIIQHLMVHLRLVSLFLSVSID